MRSFMNKLSTANPSTPGHYYDYPQQCIKSRYGYYTSMVYCSGGKSVIDIYDRLTQRLIMMGMSVVINSVRPRDAYMC